MKERRVDYEVSEGARSQSLVEIWVRGVVEEWELGRPVAAPTQ